jgi:hypothetical protein
VRHAGCWESRLAVVGFARLYNVRPRQKHSWASIEASSGGAFYEASAQIKEALFLDMRLDVVKAPA